MQRLGGYASLLTGLAFIAILVIDFAILAPQGFAGPGTSPELVLALVNKSAVPFQLLDVFSVLGSVTLLLSALAVQERLRAGAPNQMRLAVIAASIASALILLLSAADFSSTPIIAGTQNATILQASLALTDGMLNGGIFALGWMLFLWGWAGLDTKGLPKLLCYVLLLTGILGIVAFVITILGILVVILNVIWGFWLGYVLLRQPNPFEAVNNSIP